MPKPSSAQPASDLHPADSDESTTTNRVGLLAELPEPQRRLALDRFELLQPHLEDGVPLVRVAEAAGVPLRTAQRWLARYRSSGLVGLARQPRSDRGCRRLPEQLQLLIEGLALRRPAPTVAAVHRQSAKVAASKGWPVPSYGRVYDIVRNLDPAMLTLAHQGAKRYREVFDLIHRRDADSPNAIWQADHTELDFWVADPAGRPARPWLTVVLDDYSRAVCGYAVYLEAPSTLQTSLALRQAIWRKPDPAWHVCGTTRAVQPALSHR